MAIRVLTGIATGVIWVCSDGMLIFMILRGAMTYVNTIDSFMLQSSESSLHVRQNEILTGNSIVTRITPLVLVLTCVATIQSVRATDQPNILWLFAEDTSPWMGCYGDELNQGKTPNIDGLAARGVRFSRAFVPAPVCSACRSAIMGGQSQIRFNAHEHRSSRGPSKIFLPDGMKLLPEIMKENGYFTFNLGKTDYNFVWNEAATYSLMRENRADIPWDEIVANQPFFGQIQTAGGKNGTNHFPDDRKQNPDEVTVPPDYPQNQLYREVVAQHYDAIRKDDDFIGTVLEGLKQAGLKDNTIVVYFGDHGANNLVRHKQMPTEGGLHVPFVVAGPDPWVPATRVRHDLVNMLDLSATTLAWAGIDQPSWYEGQDLFGGRAVPRSFVAAAKDRMDHTIDRVRTIRTDRFRYTRNYKTDRIFLQPQYRDNRDFVINLREMYAAGTLSEKLTEIYFGERPAEEFYDVRKDPSQVNNLINDAGLTDEIQRHRDLLDRWLAAGDAGAREEPLEELAFQADGQKWGSGVNPEYEIVREDSDGDGLSDQWEQINGRDPEDGRLLFTFDCGGWQTEGWEATTKNLGNIAGRQGFLDFQLDEGTNLIARQDLKIDPARNQGRLNVYLNVDKPIRLKLSAARQGKLWHDVGREQEVDSDTTSVTFELAKDQWSGTITGLRLKITGSRGTNVEIDKISIEP